MQSSAEWLAVPQRIVSLLPGATEMLVALGALDRLAGVSHECDWPESVRAMPRVTTTPIDPLQSSGDIHAAVQQAVAEGRSVIGIDATALRFLKPDLLVTQMLCDVCAVADGEAIQLAQAMNSPPQVVSLNGRTLGGVWNDIRVLGQAIGEAPRGNRLADELHEKTAAFARDNFGTSPPRVVAIEWLEPLFLAGHWVPEMIAAAGGRDVGAEAGSHSAIRTWEEVIALEPELVLIILCGFDEARARTELANLKNAMANNWLATRRVAVLDGNAYTSRPGPRLIEGISMIAEAVSAR